MSCCRNLQNSLKFMLNKKKQLQGSAPATKHQTRLEALHFLRKRDCHIWVRFIILADFWNCKRLISLRLTGGWLSAAEACFLLFFFNYKCYLLSFYHYFILLLNYTRMSILIDNAVKFCVIWGVKSYIMFFLCLLWLLSSLIINL